VRSSVEENDIYLVGDSASYNCSDNLTVKVYALGYVHCIDPSVSACHVGKREVTSGNLEHGRLPCTAMTKTKNKLKYI
jgi:hypothetical protein